MRRWNRLAAGALGLLLAGNAGAVEVDALKRDLAGLDEAKAIDAAKHLGEAGEAPAVDALLDALTLGAPPRVQAALLAALEGPFGRKADPRTLDLLKLYAKNRNPELRRRAVATLAASTDARATALLVEALADDADEVRAEAAQALGKRKEHAAEAKLLKLFRRRDAAAGQALAQMATPELAHRLAELLGQVADAQLCDVLGAVLKRPDFAAENVRLELVKTLAKIPGVDSTGALLEYLTASQKDKSRPSRVEAQKIVDQRSSEHP